MAVSLIVATSQNNAIGKDGRLPWHLPAEMARFKEITMGHPILMGRKTHESIGRALPGRQNIIITRNPDYKAEGCDVVASLEQALETAKDKQEVFIVGGASIYDLALPQADKIYLTRVAANIDGDKFFEFDNAGWTLAKSDNFPADEKNQYAFELQEWVRNREPAMAVR